MQLALRNRQPKVCKVAPIDDHPLRYSLSNELHARPFPTLVAGSRALFMAIADREGADNEQAARDRNALIALLDRYGAQHPQPNATHYFATIGRHRIKWERHSEFVTYTLLLDGLGNDPFAPVDFDEFPPDWLAQLDGQCMVSASLRIEAMPDEATMKDKLAQWFVPESLAQSEVLDGAAIVASDFQIDPAGHTRFAAFVTQGVGQSRIGRIAQRLFEIETYKSMAMLGFAQAKGLNARVAELDSALTLMMNTMQSNSGQAEQQLDALLRISTELEALQASSSYRFGASRAYEAIVNQRISALRERPYRGRQTLAEFMMRRFDPAMRTVSAMGRRLQNMSERAIRAAQLLRTRVDVDRSAHSQKLLESMNRRADLQLRLQQTVEGLSVVAISYYAVSLASYALYPLAGATGLSKAMLSAAITLPIILIVWWLVRRIRDHSKE